MRKINENIVREKKKAFAALKQRKFFVLLLLLHRVENVLFRVDGRRRNAIHNWRSAQAYNVRRILPPDCAANSRNSQIDRIMSLIKAWCENCQAQLIAIHSEYSKGSKILPQVMPTNDGDSSHCKSKHFPMRKHMLWSSLIEIFHAHENFTREFSNGVCIVSLLRIFER